MADRETNEEANVHGKTLIHRGILVAVSLLLAGGAFQVGSAGASNFSGANGATGCSGGSPVNMADPNPHTFFYSDLAATTSDAQEWTRVNLVDPTNVNTSLLGSVNSLTDVVAYDQDYTSYCGYVWDGGMWGLTTCVSLAAGNRCEKHEVRYDNSDIDVFSVDGRRGLTCHETGHSLGLLHRDTEGSCMRTSGPYPSFYSGSHDVPHLNGNY